MIELVGKMGPHDMGGDEAGPIDTVDHGMSHWEKHANAVRMTVSGKKLATLDEIFTMMNKGKGADEILSTFKNINRTKQADGGSIDGDVSLTVIKIPDISESGVESLFKRR